MQKRGQITVLVVLGIIIVALIVLFMALKGKVIVSDWEKERGAALEVPERAREVQQFIQNCVEFTASDGTTLLGLQGGYINLPESHLVTPAHPFATYLEIFPESELRTAYWFYEAPNRVQKSGIPTIAEMEIELAQYIEDNLADCTSNFTLFESYNITAGEIVVEADIEKSEIFFTIEYPLNIRMEDFEYDIDRFYTDVDSKLGELYIIAKEIIDQDNEDFFLEEKAIDVLAMYEDIPFSGTEFTCSPKLWTKSEVKDSIKKHLATNVQFIKLEDTKFEGSEDYFTWEALESSHSDIATSFRYSSNWPIKMEVFPSEGEVLMAKPLTDVGNEAMSFLMSLFCLTDYNFVYDLSFPVLIILTDDSGYMFQFATMVIIDNNQPRQNELGTLEIPEPVQQICDNAVNPAVIYAQVPDRDGNLRPVEDAKIKIKCISTTCELGTTKLDERLSEPLLRTKIPQCVNALLTAEKPGFHIARELTSTVDEGTYSLMLEPYKLLNYELKVVEDGMIRDIEEGEVAILTIENDELKFTKTLTESSGKVQLIANDLNLKSTLITEGFDINIEGKEVTHCFKVPTKNVLGLLGFEEEQCTTATTEDMELSQVVRGGSEYLWQPSRAEFDQANKVTFYIPASSIPSNLDELEEVYADLENPLKVISPMLE